MATETWPKDSGTRMDTAQLAECISATKDIEGITFLGGEPFEQPVALAELAAGAQAAGLSVVTFTGFYYNQLLSLDLEGVSELLNLTDLLIEGPFQQQLFDLSRPWVGSSNQLFRFLTKRYCEEDLAGINNQIEVRIDAQGNAMVNGMGDFTKIKELL